MTSRYDIVVYGATGFAGAYVVKTLSNISLFKGKTIAVAGRRKSEVRNYPIIVADNSKDESLSNMARQAKVIINTVGPYILYGDAVIRAAINNGASHVDISGEPAWIERMEQKYGKMAREKGVFIIGACGFDSIPCDLGTDFVKRHFDGTLAYVETCFRINRGPAGYSFNAGTCDSLLLGIKSKIFGGEGALHRSIMPDPIPQPKYKPSCRWATFWRFSIVMCHFRLPFTKFREPALNAWALLFPGGDKAVNERSQYYDFHVNGQKPVEVYTYFTIGSFFKSILLAIWLGIFGFFALFGPARRFISAHPGRCSFGMFMKDGPSSQQIKEASFDYFFFGTGWAQGETPDGERPTKKVTAVCHGPDPGYMATSACISAVALAVLDDRHRLPRDGGVMTTASALRETRVYEYMRSMGVSFELLKDKADATQISMSSRFDIVVYGATGFTGGYVLRTLATVPLFKAKTIAVAGRNEGKLLAALETIAQETGNEDVLRYAIITADSSDDESLANMAKQAKVIINTVGPYILHGEAVLRAAVDNGANHVDISGEPAFLEQMELKYGQMAREKGVYIVGACGWDSIPCDLGTDFLKRRFDGTLAYVETCVRTNSGPEGYAVNTGTYDSLILGIKSKMEGGEAALHKSVMPEPMPESKHRIPIRFPMSYMNESPLNAWVMPFMGSDKSIVERSQYYDFQENGERPVQIRTFFTLGSLFNMLCLAIWAAGFAFFALFGLSRRFLAAYPEVCSFGMFKKDGPTQQQVKETSFDYYIFGTGWAEGEAADVEKPTKKACYMATSACICASALALIEDKAMLPQKGGVFTTASAFRDTHIYAYLRTMGVTFDIIPEDN